MTREEWARALLGRLGYSASKSNVTALLAWMRAEGGNWNNSAHFNPLNTTQRMSGSSSMNSVGVQSYTSWDQGLAATVKTLRNGYYGGILSALSSGNSANAVANAVVSSPWGTKSIPLSGITVTGAGSSGASYGGTVTPTLSREELASSYGLTAALVNSSKELKSLFNKAVSGQWSAAKFQASLKNTKWWRTQSSTLRKYITTKFEDPATFKQNWGNAQYKVNQLAVQVGLGNQILKGGKSSKLLKEAIYNSLALGWSDDRIKDWLGTKATTHGGVMWGEAGEAFDKLHTTAYLNGMKYSSDWYKKQAVSIVSGKSTQETVEAQVRKAAAAHYSAFSNQILAGQNVMDLAAPYIKSLSTLLEIPETDVDLFNRHIAGAMTAKPAAGAGSDGAQMPLWKFENEVRNDPLWRKTNNARESMMTVAHQVAKDFGVAY